MQKLPHAELHKGVKRYWPYACISFAHRTVLKMPPGGWKSVQNRSREVEKHPVGGSKMASWSPSEGSWARGGPHMAAKAARKPTLGGSGDALGALLAALGTVLVPLGPLLARSWGLLGVSWGFLGRSWQRKLDFHANLEKHCKNAVRFRPRGSKLASSWA